MHFNRLFQGGLIAAATAMPVAVPAARAASPFPLQLEMRAPFEPTAFPSAGRTYLVYELYLTNFTGNLDLRRLEILD
jgi:hypothetical protein